MYYVHLGDQGGWEPLRDILKSRNFSTMKWTISVLDMSIYIKRVQAHNILTELQIIFAPWPDIEIFLVSVFMLSTCSTMYFFHCQVLYLCLLLHYYPQHLAKSCLKLISSPYCALSTVFFCFFVLRHVRHHKMKIFRNYLHEVNLKLNNRHYGYEAVEA